MFYLAAIWFFFFFFLVSSYCSKAQFSRTLPLGIIKVQVSCLWQLMRTVGQIPLPNLSSSATLFRLQCSGEAGWVTSTTPGRSCVPLFILACRERKKTPSVCGGSAWLRFSIELQCACYLFLWCVAIWSLFHQNGADSWTGWEISSSYDDDDDDDDIL